jgi:hypothetical protein
MPTAAVGQIEIEAEGKVIGMTSGTTANLLDGSPVTQSVIQRSFQRVGDKTKAIQKVAFTGPVWPN